jgi:transaldolase/glucose-6-phosphate isomerase
VGAWLEQLVAESTGKGGVSIIPVDREVQLEPKVYGDDRVFVFLTVGKHPGLESFSSEIQAAGHPCVSIHMDDANALGQEFFRWEFATAVAGALMGINPFDQPDVESAKIEAKKITGAYEATGELPVEEPFHRADGIDFYGDPVLSNSVEVADSAKVTISKHLARIVADDYFALLAYLEMTDETEELLQSIRETVLRKYNVATCLGFGPRFLHSTGQAYKGGAPNGVFLQITSDDAVDFEVPGQKYTFGIVKAAQSRGDFQVLLDRERRAMRIHIGSDVIRGLKMLNEMIAGI